MLRSEMITSGVNSPSAPETVLVLDAARIDRKTVVGQMVDDENRRRTRCPRREESGYGCRRRPSQRSGRPSFMTAQNWPSVRTASKNWSVPA